MRANRMVSWVVCGSLVLAGATACGNGADDRDAAIEVDAGVVPSVAPASASLQSFVRDSAERTEAVGTFHFALTVDVADAAGLDDATVLSADGVVDAAAGRASLTATFAGLEGLVGGEDAAGGLDGVFGSLAEPTELVVDGSTLYVRGGVVGLLAGSGGGWLSLPATDGGSLGVGLTGSSASDLVDLLREAGDVAEVGSEVVDGVDATHLRVDVDEQALADRLPAGVGAVDVGGVSATVDVWIGSDGIVRRMVVDADGGDGQVTVQLDLDGLGDPVDVVVPDPADVTAFDAAAFGGLGDLVESFGG